MYPRECSNNVIPIMNKHNLSVSDMMIVVAKAYLALGRTDGSSRIKRMDIVRLMAEYQWAVVLLDTKGLLTPAEYEGAELYKRDYVERSFA